MSCYSSKYKVAQKMAQFFWYALTSSNINRFSKLFHYQNQEKICNNIITKYPTIPQVCRYTTLWNVKCLKSNSWKQDVWQNGRQICLDFLHRTKDHILFSGKKNGWWVRLLLPPVLSQCTRLTDRQTDRRTDRQNSHRKAASVFHAAR